MSRAAALIELLSGDLPKDMRQRLYERLHAELEAHAATEAPLSLIRLALLEESLAAKPDRMQIYVWYSLASAMGDKVAPALRERAVAHLRPRDIPLAEVEAAKQFGAWCAQMGAKAPEICRAFVALPALAPKEAGQG